MSHFGDAGHADGAYLLLLRHAHGPALDMSFITPLPGPTLQGFPSFLELPLDMQDELVAKASPLSQSLLVLTSKEQLARKGPRWRRSTKSLLLLCAQEDDERLFQHILTFPAPFFEWKSSCYDIATEAVKHSSWVFLDWFFAKYADQDGRGLTEAWQRHLHHAAGLYNPRAWDILDALCPVISWETGIAYLRGLVEGGRSEEIVSFMAENASVAEQFAALDFGWSQLVAPALRSQNLETIELVIDQMGDDTRFVRYDGLTLPILRHLTAKGFPMHGEMFNAALNSKDPALLKELFELKCPSPLVWNIAALTRCKDETELELVVKPLLEVLRPVLAPGAPQVLLRTAMYKPESCPAYFGYLVETGASAIEPSVLDNLMPSTLDYVIKARRFLHLIQ